MRHVMQADGYGCGLACLAIVTDKTYDEVKAWDGFVGKNFRNAGLTYDDLMQYLGDHGFATMFRWRYLPGSCTQQRNVRSPWPSPSFAPVHLVGVRDGMHLVVLLPDGTVLDPSVARPMRLEECGHVAWMMGVFRVAP